MFDLHRQGEIEQLTRRATIIVESPIDFESVAAIIQPLNRGSTRNVTGGTTCSDEDTLSMGPESTLPIIDLTTASEDEEDAIDCAHNLLCLKDLNK